MDQYVVWVSANYFGDFKRIHEREKDDKNLNEIQEEALSVLKINRDKRLDNLANLISQAAGVDGKGKERIKNFLSSSNAKKYLSI